MKKIIYSAKGVQRKNASNLPKGGGCRRGKIIVFNLYHVPIKHNICGNNIVEETHFMCLLMEAVYIMNAMSFFIIPQ